MTSHVSSRGSSGHASHRSHRHRRHRSAAKPFLILHSLNALFASISIILFVTILPIWNANFFHETGLIKGDWPDALPLLPLIIVLWTSITYIAQSVISNRRRKGVQDHKSHSESTSILRDVRRSKINLYLRLTSLVLLLTFLILAGISGLYRFWRPAVISSAVKMSSGTSSTLSITLKHRRDISDANPTTLTPPTNSPAGSTTQNTNTLHSCSLANVFTRKCNPTLYVIGDLQIAAITIGAIVWLLNLVLLVLQAREYQYQKRKHAKSLRAKAKAKMLLLEKEDDVNWAEKGLNYASRSKRSYKTPERPSRDRAASDPRSHSSSDKSSRGSTITRPNRAYTSPSSKATLGPSLSVRPKQHHYNPEIAPGRSRNEPAQPSFGHDFSTTSYTRAVEEARKKVRPAESMRDWLATRRS